MGVKVKQQVLMKRQSENVVPRDTNEININRVVNLCKLLSIGNTEDGTETTPLELRCLGPFVFSIKIESVNAMKELSYRKK